jgi:formylmethanofuran dehydrogenase subunit D
MAVNKVVFGDRTVVDLTGDSVTADTMLEGVTAHDKSGAQITGTAVIPTVNNGKLTIQKNGTTVATFTANQSAAATANITVPVKVSELTNDSNFVADKPTFTEASSRANIASGETFATILGKIKKFFTDLKTVAFTGSYNDLSNKPTIPTVNNATLTIQKNGTTVKTFTANASSNVTANITVPTKVSELTNDSGYVTTDTNTHRPIQVNGTEILGNNTTALNLKAGSNVTLSNSSGTVTIAATDTNNSVTQTNTTASGDYRVLLSNNANDTTETTTARKSTNLMFNPSTGLLKSKSGYYSHTFSNGGGTSGYFRFLRITITAKYTDTPIIMSIAHRKHIEGVFTIRFAGSNTTDPNMAICCHRGADLPFYYIKAATSTWDFYVEKVESYDSCVVNMLNPAQVVKGGMTLTWVNETVTSLPSGYSTSVVENRVLNITGNADTVNNLTVQTAVPANAKFTDTTYSAGSNITLSGTTFSLTKANVTGALGYTPPTSDTNTHRPIKVNGTEILGNNTTALNLKAGSNVSVTNSSGTVTIAATDTDTKNTAGSTNTSSKIFLIGATSQAANPQTYSQDTAYVGTDGCLYSGGAKVLTAHQSIAGKVDKKTTLDTYYGTCSTAAGTAAKVITVTDDATNFSLRAGITIVVKFTATNTAANPTFDVNSTGAKKVWYNTALITTGSLGYAGTANRPMQFTYDGTQWVFVGWSYDANTTYSAMSVSELTTGTATTSRVVRADYLNTGIKAIALPLSGGVMTGPINLHNEGSLINSSGAASSATTFIKGSAFLNLCSPGIQCRNFADNGWAGITGTSFTPQNNSSRKIKENIKPITEEEAQKLLEVNVVSFDYKQGVGFGDGDERKGKFGVIAEEINEVIPSVVSYQINTDHTIDYNIPSGVSYDKFVPHLIKMVQMQQKEIDDLKKQVDYLFNSK